MSGDSTPTFKCLLIGDSRTGKTSYINKLMNRVFDENYIATENVVSHSVYFRTNNGLICFNVWDIPGSAVFNTDPSYFSEADCSIIMFANNDLKSYKHLKVWYHRLNVAAGNMPVYICGNKSDMANCEITSRRVDYLLQRNATQGRISVKQNWHVVEPFVWLSRKVLHNNVNNAQPYKHHQCFNRLENALENMRRRSATNTKSARSLNYETPYSIYYSIYGQNNEPDENFYNADNGGRGYYSKNIEQNNRRKGFSGNLAEEERDQLKQRRPTKLAAARVDVEDLRVKMPPHAAARWVEIDKCTFNTQNSTLDTRLIFPDLTISGKVVLQPMGGKCNMILRMRHAGIEFHTTPIGFETMTTNEESRRIGAASVRTDSHFAEPGFISVFAHGCQGATGIKLRQNSKRRYGFTGEPQAPAVAPDVELSEPQVVLGNANANRWGKYFNPYHPGYDIRHNAYMRDKLREPDLDFSWNNHDSGSKEFFDPNGDNFYRKSLRYKRNLETRTLQRSYRSSFNDEMNFNDDVLNITDDLQDLLQPDARAFADLFSNNAGSNSLFSTADTDRNDIDDAFTKELEKLFSLGVRGLLTTYMQRALQPAIKETLMENMGYTLSYG